jgi:hypothetical protein
MENQPGRSRLSPAGYIRMDTFFTYIPGMMSRIGNHDFPDYSADELTQIAAVMAGQQVRH